MGAASQAQGLLHWNALLEVLTSLSELVSLFLCYEGRCVTGTGTIALDPTFGS